MIVKKFLFVMRTPPYHGIRLQEKLDALLTTAAFEQKLTLLFLDDGVFQLKKTQLDVKQPLKNTSRLFNALAMYDITTLYNEIESMQERGLKPSDLSLSVKSLYRKDINRLMQQFDVIVSG